MAYERLWQFMTPPAPSTPANVDTETKNFLFLLKQLMKGANVASYTAGGWTVTGSCDGTTAAMDGVDRWVTEANIVYTNGAGTRSWIVLKSPAAVNGTYCYVCMNAWANGSPGNLDIHVAPVPFTGGTTTAPPTATISNGAGTSSAMTPNDAVNPHRYYGALSTTGDFWLILTILGVTVGAYMIINPVGVKSNDQFPYYHNFGYLTSPGMLVSGIVPNSFRQTVNYALAYPYYYGLITPPAFQSPLTDMTDTSLFDFPAWVMLGNASSFATSTAVHPRGRLPDIGVIGGNTSGPPVPTGNSVLVGGNVAYITAGNLLLPYNGAVS